MFDFQKFEVYKKAKDFNFLSKEILDEYPPEKFVYFQLRRAAFSVVLNIAEGSGRFTNPDRKNFFIISRSSVYECVAIMDLLHDSETVSTEVYHQYLSKADELSRILYSMIQKLS